MGEFRIKGKIIGGQGKNMKHIQDQSGSKITVDESGDFVTVSANSQEDLDNAVGMVSDLIGTIMEEYDQWLEENGRGQEGGGRKPDKGKGKSKGDKKGKGKGKDSKDGGRGDRGGDFTEVLELEETDPAFHLRAKIIGDKGKNVHHIQDQTKAKLYLDCENGMRLNVSAHSQEDLDKVVGMANDLIGAVLEDYDQWCEEQAGAEEDGGRSGKQDRKGGKGKDKGKGKGKRKSSDKDRPAKRQRTD